jgi:hypothetical protein
MSTSTAAPIKKKTLALRPSKFFRTPTAGSSPKKLRVNKKREHSELEEHQEEEDDDEDILKDEEDKDADSSQEVVAVVPPTTTLKYYGDATTPQLKSLTSLKSLSTFCEVYKRYEAMQDGRIVVALTSYHKKSSITSRLVFVY